jgi:hypothetical protein
MKEHEQAAKLEAAQAESRAIGLLIGSVLARITVLSAELTIVSSQKLCR